MLQHWPHSVEKTFTMVPLVHTLAPGRLWQQYVAGAEQGTGQLPPEIARGTVPFATQSVAADVLVCALPSCQRSDVKLMRCAQCEETRYCSRECQVADWKAHRKVCDKI
jgi:hypothetical protein